MIIYRIRTEIMCNKDGHYVQEQRGRSLKLGMGDPNGLGMFTCRAGIAYNATAGDARKLWRKFIGPFEVLETIDGLSYRLNFT
jgi:hypothetical protein